MDIISEAFDVQEIEKALCQLDDVQAARIVTDESKTIEEIHIVAAPAKGAKQLVRDVETTLLARYGIPVNHRKISVAQVNPLQLYASPVTVAVEDTTPEEAVAVETNDVSTRLKILSVHNESSGSRARASVCLGLRDVEHEGAAEGFSSQTERLRLVAQATLEAVSQFVPPSVCFALEDVCTVSLGKENVAVACITHVGSFGEHILVGSALVRQNDKDSIVRATLDAINRRFSFLKTI
ncbi:MAG: hypothetical protein ACYC1U_05885 [Candidatus Aquicultorales bacterium]